MKRKAKPALRKDLRIVVLEGTPLDQMVTRLELYYGIDRPAVLKMALKRLDSVTPDE